MKRNINHQTPHVQVTSSTMRSIGYDAKTGDMHVTFHDGGRYVYHNIPPHVYDGLMMAGSKGSYLHNQIKGNFDFTKL